MNRILELHQRTIVLSQVLNYTPYTYYYIDLMAHHRPQPLILDYFEMLETGSKCN